MVLLFEKIKQCLEKAEWETRPPPTLFSNPSLNITDQRKFKPEKSTKSEKTRVYIRYVPTVKNRFLTFPPCTHNLNKVWSQTIFIYSKSAIFLPLTPSPDKILLSLTSKGQIFRLISPKESNFDIFLPIPNSMTLVLKIWRTNQPRDAHAP